MRAYQARVVPEPEAEKTTNGGTMFDDLMEEGGGLMDRAQGLSEVKDDVILLKDEAGEIMREIEEVKKLAISLMERQQRVIEAIGRLKGTVGID